MKHYEYPEIGEHISHCVLDNGLNVFYIRKLEYAKAHALFVTDYGSVDTRYRLDGEWVSSPAGAAHYLEHKMFDMPYGSALSKFSAKGASANAFTSKDSTAYYFSCTEGFYDNLKLLLEFVSFPYFTDESVSKERGIIGQEIRMYENNPYSVARTNLLRALYAAHPVREPIAGTVESIAQITKETLYSCHEAFYRPSNMALCVAGELDFEKVIELADSILPKGASPKIKRNYGSEKSILPVTKTYTQNLDVGVPVFALGLRLENGDLLKTQVIGEIAMQYLAGQSSKLYSRMYAGELIDSGFQYGISVSANEAMALFCGNSKDAFAVRNEIQGEFSEILNTDFNEVLFERIKKAQIGYQIMLLNNFNTLCYNVAEGCFKGYDAMKSVEIIRSTEMSDVIDFIRANLRPERMALSIVTKN